MHPGIRRRLRPLIGLAALAGCLLPLAAADDPKPAHSAVKPEPRQQAYWTKRHEAFQARAAKGDVDVLFLGDSITQGWEGEKGGKKVWVERFEPLKAANFGIGGDRTQHVLWRITAGKELEGIDPKVVVLMIGTNNMRANSAAEIADGITAIVEELRKQKPKTKVLLLGVFPRSPKADNPVRDKIKDVNRRIAKLDDGKRVRYLDIGGKFLDKDGNLPKETMPDFLHLSPDGYQIWADAIRSDLTKLLGK